MPVGSHQLPTQLSQSCSGGTIYCFAQWANTVTQGLFWIFALLSFCVATFIATNRFGNNRAFGFASFVGAIGSIWLVVLNLLTWYYASAFIIVGLIGLAVMRMSET